MMGDITLRYYQFKEARINSLETMSNPEDLYSGRILELAANISHTERLVAPHATASLQAKLCGSSITVDLTMEGDVITGYGQDVKACLLGQTAAAILSAHIIGTTAGELREVHQQMRKMLKEGGEPPTGKWRDLSVLAPVREYPVRHASTLLAFDAVEEAIRQIEARQSR
jgi:NifU-like protein involved in Fe-S cluster formation